MPYTQSEILEHSKRIGRSPRCLRYWIAEGCDLKNAASVEAFLQAKELRKTNVQKVRERRGGSTQAARAQGQCAPQTRFQPVGNGDLPPAGKRGPAAALERLEHQEEESHRRLQAALARGNPVEVQAAQKFWLRCSETLRRLDLAVEIAVGRRKPRSRFERLKMRSPRQPNVPGRSGICFLLLTPCC